MLRNFGCNCVHCQKGFEDNLKRAKDEWDNGRREIVLNSFWRGEDCGTELIVNDMVLNPVQGNEPWIVIETLMNFLEIKNVRVDMTEEENE